MAYSEDAFNCAKCPGSGGCPAFWETIWEHNGETKLVKGCGFEQLPMYLLEVIKAANRPAAAIESTRNELTSGLRNLANAVHTGNGLVRNRRMLNNETIS